MRRRERELDEEVRSYRELLRDEGLDARAAAIALGGEDQIKEAVRAARPGAWLEALGRDARHAARRLRQRPGYALAVVAVLGVGIGLTTALFSAVQALILRPLPFPQPQQLVQVLASNYSVAGDQLNQPLQAGLRPIFSDYAGYRALTVNTADGGGPARLRIAAVTADFFSMLGVRLVRGPGFSRTDFFWPRSYTWQEATPPTPVVLGNALWRGRYGAEPGIIGRVLNWGGVSYRVVGIAPSGFGFPFEAQAWIPYGGVGMNVFYTRFDDPQFITIAARLRPGLGFEAAEAQMAAWVKQHRNSNAVDPPFLVPLQRALMGDRRGLALLLWAASGLVLALACAGAVGLGAGQAWTRRRELALRLAIGASAGRIRRQLLTEGLMLGVAGGVTGWLLAALAGRWFAQLWPPAVASAGAAHGAAAGVASLLALGCGVAVGMAGSRRHWTLDSERYGRGAGPARALGGEWLTAVQLALAAILLTATAALGHSWLQLTHVSTGFNPRGVLVMEVSLPYESEQLLGYPNNLAHVLGGHLERATVGERAEMARAEDVLARIDDFEREAPPRIRALPGVAAAGLLGALPFSPAGPTVLGVARLAPRSGEHPRLIDAAAVPAGPGALEALGLAPMAGRDFSSADTSGCTTIFSASLARAAFAGADTHDSAPALPADVAVFPHQPCKLIGVVADAKLTDLRQAAMPVYYDQLDRYPDPIPFLVVRAAPGVAPLALAGPVRRELQQLAPRAAISHVTTLETLLNDTHAPLNQATALFGLFALLAAAIAGLSVFALAMQAAIARTREIGVRMALGAAPGEIRRWMLARQAGMTLAALAVAAPAAWVLERALARWLYRVTPGDGASYGVAALTLALVVLGATWWPALRASRVAPMEALRHE
ncbi:MAG: ABC transporter permease [Terriglobales bacterium]